MVLMRNSRSWRKRPAADLGVEVGVGRRDQADVGPPRPRRAEPLEVAGLEHAQQLVLLAERDVGNLVEEQRAALGHLEAADAVGLGVGERAADVAEQLALEDAFGHAAGVDGDERPRRAGRDRVQGLGHQALAGAVLAGDQDVGVGRTDARDHLQHRLHRRRVRDQVRLPVAAQHQVLGFEPLAAAQRPRQLDLRPHDGQEPRVVPRLLDEVAGAAAHGFDRDVDAAPGGHHHRRQRRVHGPHGVQEVEALLARGRVPGVVQVHQEDVELLVLERGDDAGRRGGGVDLIALALEQQPQRFEHVGLVVGDEQPARRRRSAGPLAIFGEVETRRKGV